MRNLFGTDGIRGVANRYPMTCEMALTLGRAAAHIFKQNVGPHRMVIGKDTRLSGYMLESALTAGLCSFGVEVLVVGPLPTPAIAFLTRSFRADAGIMISASHNPFEDNGIKFFSKNGLKLPDETEAEIERLITSGAIDHIRPTARDIGKAYRMDDAMGRYIEFTKNSLPKGFDMQGLKVVIDCANGAAYKVAPTILREVGVALIPIHDHPDGTNINLNCGALCPADLKREVLRHQADVGIAYDGDADRAVFVDEKGHVVAGEALLAIFAQHLHAEKRLAGNTLVTTQMSNKGLERALQSEGISVVRTKVGDRYVLEKMCSGGYNLGGEQSGHIIFFDYNTTGDGLVASLQFLAILKQTGKTVSELTTSITLLPQIVFNVKVRKKLPLANIPGLEQAVEKIQSQMDGSGRLLLRYSGTENVLRIMLEGEDEKMLSGIGQELVSLVERQVGLS